MRMKNLMIIPTLLILAIMMTGFAYAHWEKIVTINATVETGKLDLIIVDAVDNDNGIDPKKDKDIADTTIEIDPIDPEKAIIKITNAYPCYYVTWHITIRNVGTIPAKLKEIIIGNPDPSCLEVKAWNKLGEQLDPYSWDREEWYYQGDYSGSVHVLQGAEQGASYTFTVKFVFWNWNEV